MKEWKLRGDRKKMNRRRRQVGEREELRMGGWTEQVKK